MGTLRCRLKLREAIPLLLAESGQNLKGNWLDSMKYKLKMSPYDPMYGHLQAKQLVCVVLETQKKESIHETSKHSWR